jgi:predicted Zn-dependent peptidase
MFRMANSEVYFNRLITVDEITGLIESVTADELIELANELLLESNLTKIIISSKGSILKTAA